MNNAKAVHHYSFKCTEVERLLEIMKTYLSSSHLELDCWLALLCFVIY